MHPQKPDSTFDSFFLGPQSENHLWATELWQKIFLHWVEWRKSLFPQDGSAFTALPRSQNLCYQNMKEHLNELLRQLESETPKFTPRYMGHMVSEVSLPAFFGHIAMLLHNPNNASEEVAKTGHKIEVEAINALLQMVGFPTKEGRGHFTSGGTIANLEAFWRARFRWDHWLALGLALFERDPQFQEQCQGELFRCSMMGWSHYDQLREQYQVGEDEIRTWSLSLLGPWEFQKKWSKISKENFAYPILLVPGNKHYSWNKAVNIFGMGDSAFWPVDLDEYGKLCVKSLKEQIDKALSLGHPILMVVSVAGSTELGEIDPVDKVQELLDQYKQEQGIHIWHHVDGAYGGYYTSCLHERSLLSPAQKQENQLQVKSAFGATAYRALKAIRQVNSITLDPHKLGYVPYACGAILVPDERSYEVSSFRAPYLIEKKRTTHPEWSTTLEGSRSATGAAATWLSAKSIGLNSQGYGSFLLEGLKARAKLYSLLRQQIPHCHLVEPIDTNIAAFTLAKEGESLSLVNQRVLRVYNEFVKSPYFAVSKTLLHDSAYSRLMNKLISKWNGVKDTQELLLIRMVLMNPYVTSTTTHLDYLGAVVEQIKEWSEV